MPGLELAARDLARGVLTDLQLQRIVETIAALVAEIGSQPDEQAETDEHYATMLGQSAASLDVPNWTLQPPRCSHTF